MQKQAGKVGTIRRNVRGKACPYCGEHKYQLVLRPHCSPENAGLFARCTQCQRPHGLDEELGRILWM